MTLNEMINTELSVVTTSIVQEVKISLDYFLKFKRTKTSVIVLAPSKEAVDLIVNYALVEHGTDVRHLVFAQIPSLLDIQIVLTWEPDQLWSKHSL